MLGAARTNQNTEEEQRRSKSSFMQKANQSNFNLSFTKELFKKTGETDGGKASWAKKKRYSMGPGSNAQSRTIEGQLHMISVGINNNVAISKRALMNQESRTPRPQMSPRRTLKLPSTSRAHGSNRNKGQQTATSRNFLSTSPHSFSFHNSKQEQRSQFNTQQTFGFGAMIDKTSNSNLNQTFTSSALGHVTPLAALAIDQGLPDSLSIEQSQDVFSSRLKSLKPVAGNKPTEKQKRALKSMLNCLSPQSTHEMIQRRLNQDQTMIKRQKSPMCIITNSQVANKQGSAIFKRSVSQIKPSRDTNQSSYKPNDKQVGQKNSGETMTGGRTQRQTDHESNMIRKSIEEKGYSLRLQQHQNKALKDTLNMRDQDLKNEILQSVNQVSRHVVLKKKYRKQPEGDPMINYVQALVIASPPAVQTKDGTEFEFEPELSSQPLQDIKRSLRHLKADKLLRQDPMLVVPKQQIQRVPGMIESDTCVFDIFPHSVKLAHNFKRDLRRAMKKRTSYSISNIKLPEMKQADRKFCPLKCMKPIENSDSLLFDPTKPRFGAEEPRESEADLDVTLANIRSYLKEHDQVKIKGISPAMIDQIYCFQHMNVLSLESNIDELIRQQQLGEDPKKHKHNHQQNKLPSDEQEKLYHKPKEVSRILSLQLAIENKAALKANLETQFRGVIKKFTSHDAKEMIKRHKDQLSGKKTHAAHQAESELDKDGLSEQQRVMMRNTPRGRFLDNHEAYERMYQDELNDAYLRKYTALSQQMVINYKQQAINTFLTQMYCNPKEHNKYIGKYKDVIEKSIYNKRGWYRVQEMFKANMTATLSKLSDRLPFSLKKAIKQLHELFKINFEVQDLDHQTKQQTIKMYTSEIANVDSSESNHSSDSFNQSDSSSDDDYSSDYSESEHHQKRHRIADEVGLDDNHSKANALFETRKGKRAESKKANEDNSLVSSIVSESELQDRLELEDFKQDWQSCSPEKLIAKIFMMRERSEHKTELMRMRTITRNANKKFVLTAAANLLNDSEHIVEKKLHPLHQESF